MRTEMKMETRIKMFNVAQNQTDSYELAEKDFFNELTN